MGRLCLQSRFISQQGKILSTGSNKEDRIRVSYMLLKPVFLRTHVASCVLNKCAEYKHISFKTVIC